MLACRRSLVKFHVPLQSVKRTEAFFALGTRFVFDSVLLAKVLHKMGTYVGLKVALGAVEPLLLVNCAMHLLKVGVVLSRSVKVARAPLESAADLHVRVHADDVLVQISLSSENFAAVNALLLLQIIIPFRNRLPAPFFFIGHRDGFAVQIRSVFPLQVLFVVKIIEIQSAKVALDFRILRGVNELLVFQLFLLGAEVERTPLVRAANQIFSLVVHLHVSPVVPLAEGFGTELARRHSLIVRRAKMFGLL